MSLEEQLREKLEAAVKDKKGKDEKAEAAIWAAVLVNGGLGVVPVGINIWTFVVVNAVMVGVLGKIYEYYITHEEAGKLILHIFTSVGLTWMVITLGVKFGAEVLKITAIGTLPGMALDAVLCGAVTYALGFTSKNFFAKGRDMSAKEIREVFKKMFEEGKEKIKKERS